MFSGMFLFASWLKMQIKSKLIVTENKKTAVMEWTNWHVGMYCMPLQEIIVFPTDLLILNQFQGQCGSCPEPLPAAEWVSSGHYKVPVNAPEDKLQDKYGFRFWWEIDRANGTSCCQVIPFSVVVSHTNTEAWKCVRKNPITHWELRRIMYLFSTASLFG